MVSQLETQATGSNRHSYTIGGLIQVFTSPYRSFFTNVMAQALGIAGQGRTVLVVQFLKGGIGQGHEHPVKLGQNLDWLRCDLPRCIDTAEIEDTEMLALLDLWRYTQSVVAEGKYSLVVLDELSLAINFGLIPETEVLAFLENRPCHVDVILTGPEVSESIRNVADQITELRRSDRP
ncbi:P-loop NTPase family protein [Leptolyngbya sp. FACHB-671]|uniref:P-loop NTPase family protein n=1 Tax=Leptolyngbya sp. FACHB-671 TaxID=2692812 RepID=UPI001682AEA6|nr:P-loop NTPase family protein [Leptolyngbya sp. FACHB-671]MBD2067040.1 P-loop NTPase family protein [Leptolyngbya sp. FACHB-671]